MSATEIQTLLRFLSQDAKVPLAAAMSKIKPLQAAALTNVDSIAKVKVDDLKPIFEDEKISKQVLNAAKRISKKRAAGDETVTSSKKRPRSDKSIFSLKDEQTPAQLEAELVLPSSDASPEDIADVAVYTNRAPLVLAFIVVLLKYTMPEQPLSSRLSLSQTYVSVTSRARAVSLGIENGQSAEELGMGLGQATVTIMGKELRVLKRWGYEWKDDETDAVKQEPSNSAADKDGVETKHGAEQQHHQSEQPPLWGLDLEALKNSTTPAPTLALAQSASTTNMPIHRPQAARAYLLKSFDNPPNKTTAKDQPSSSSSNSKRPASAASKAADKERNLGLLLRALDLLYQSWIDTLGPEDLDRRAWGWYVRVRPAVERGVAGWGGKNEVRLGDILALRRESS